MRDVTAKTGCVLIALFLTFGAIELALRLADYRPMNEQGMNEQRLSPTGYYWVCDKRLGFRNRTRGSYRYDEIIYKPISSTDNLGFRNEFGWSYNSDSPIILFVGDSTTFCAEVNDTYTIPSEVAKLLSHKFAVRVLNAGVRGYNTVQSKRMLQECLDKIPNIALVVYIYCDNDYFENMNPEINSAKSPTVKWDNGTLKVIEVTDPTVPWGHSFDELEVKERDSVRLKITNYLRSKSALVHLTLLTCRKLDQFYKIRREVERARKNHADEALEELVRQMNQICQSKKITFLSTYFYCGSTLYGSNIDYSVICRRAGVQYIDPKDYFTDVLTSYLAKKSDGTFDQHYGPKGTKTFATVLEPILTSILNRRKTHEEKAMVVLKR